MAVIYSHFKIQEQICSQFQMFGVSRLAQCLILHIQHIQIV